MNINLMFHEVGLNNYSGFYRDGSYNYVISKDEFKLLIDFSIHYSSLTSNNYHYSFDDGGISNMFSAEYLSKKMLKGIFFIPSNYIGKKGFLTSKDILELKNNGHVIGSHSHTHPRFINKLDYNSQFNEWNKSIQILSEIINENIKCVSFPNGLYNNNTLDILNDLNIKKVYTSIPKTILVILKT